MTDDRDDRAERPSSQSIHDWCSTRKDVGAREARDAARLQAPNSSLVPVIPKAWLDMSCMSGILGGHPRPDRVRISAQQACKPLQSRLVTDVAPSVKPKWRNHIHLMPILGASGLQER